MKIAELVGTSKPALTRRLKSRLELQEVRLRGLRTSVARAGFLQCEV
jgi:hypothetical protein